MRLLGTLLTLFLLHFPPALLAGGKLALVIGNADYRHLPRLENPVNDARDVARLLERHLGYEIYGGQPQINLTQTDLYRVIAGFSNAVVRENAEIALIYFAGHGAQLKRSSSEAFLIPVELRIEHADGRLNLDQAADRSVSVRYLESAVASAQLGLVIFDACREIPNLGRWRKIDISNEADAWNQAGRNLFSGDSTAAEGGQEKPYILSVYSVSENGIASDGPGERNSPFTSSLLDAIRNDGTTKDIKAFFDEVRLDVYERTGGKQIPLVITPIPIEPNTWFLNGKARPGPVDLPVMIPVSGGGYRFGVNRIDRSELDHSRYIQVQNFEIGETEVTQEQWIKVMHARPPFFQQDCPTCPVSGVSYRDIQKFIQKLNAATGGAYRLPTEYEWEFACREAGSILIYCGGNSPDRLAWYQANTNRKMPVRQGLPNALGIFDMSGNVAELTCTRYLPQPKQAAACDSGTTRQRVFRGGAWDSQRVSIESTARNYLGDGERNPRVGFRLARSR